MSVYWIRSELAAADQTPAKISPLTAVTRIVAHRRNDVSVRAAGFDPFSAIVIFGGGPQVAVRQQIAGDTNLVRCGDSPRRCRGIARVVRRDPNAKPATGVSRHNWAERRSRERAPF
jgi:hypothetical protein